MGEKIVARCKYRDGKWCHHPNLEYQDKCSYYCWQEKCPEYEPLVEGDII